MQIGSYDLLQAVDLTPVVRLRLWLERGCGHADLGPDDEGPPDFRPVSVVDRVRELLNGVDGWVGSRRESSSQAGIRQLVWTFA